MGKNICEVHTNIWVKINVRTKYMGKKVTKYMDTKLMGKNYMGKKYKRINNKLVRLYIY